MAHNDDGMTLSALLAHNGDSAIGNNDATMAHNGRYGQNQQSEIIGHFRYAGQLRDDNDGALCCGASWWGVMTGRQRGDNGIFVAHNA